MGRYIDKNRSGYECSMVLHKLYSETSPTEELKEGIAVGEEVGRDDGTIEGSDDGAVVGLKDGAAEGPNDGTVEGSDDGAVVGLKDGAAEGPNDGTVEGWDDGAVVGLEDGTAEGVDDGVIVEDSLYWQPQLNCCAFSISSHLLVPNQFTNA